MLISADQIVLSGATNGSHPSKRQKTVGPVITRYPPPPNRQLQNPQQRSFTHPPVGHHSTPLSIGQVQQASAKGQSYSSWNAQHQHSPHTAQAGKKQWHPPGPSTPISSYGTQHASPVSTNGNGHHQNFHHPQVPSSATQASPLRHGSYSSVAPSAAESPSVFEPSMYPQRRTSQQAKFVSDALELETSVETETWLEELQALDFPECKPASGQIGTCASHIVALRPRAC